MEHMIYYVEDDTNIRNLALYALESQGLEACGFSEAESFRQACSQRIPQLILLDIMLPGEDGLSVLAWVRNNPKLCDVPVMILTAKGTEYDKVVGLDAGNGDLRAGDGVALGVVVVFQVDPQALGAGGQVLPAGDQVASHDDAVDVLKVGVLLDIGIPIRGQRGLDDGHVKPGVVGDEGLAHQHGVQLLPDGEEVWGVHRVSGADAVDPDIAPLVFVSGGLDEPMGRGYHL